jgi:hypothetical protein
MEYIYTSLLLCFPASCFSELFKGEAVETLLSVMVANHNDYEADDVECKMSNSACLHLPPRLQQLLSFTSNWWKGEGVR